MEPTTITENDVVTPVPFKRTLVVRVLDIPMWGRTNKAKNLQLAMLEWGADNHIRLYPIDNVSESVGAAVLDCALSEIESVNANLLHMYIWFKDIESFSLDFSDEAIQAAASGKDFRSSSFYIRNFFTWDEERSLLHDTGNDLQWWVWNFARAGVPKS